MFDIKKNEIDRLESTLGKMSKKAIPFATKQTVNTAGFVALNISKARVKKRMILRNAFTLRSIQIIPTKSLVIRDQEARVGSTADYMEKQEFGFTRKKQGKHGAPIPTSWASGEGPGVLPRRKAIRAAKKLSIVKMTRSQSGRNRRQGNKLTIMKAIKDRRRHVYLDLGRRSGIYQVVGGKRKFKLRKLYDLSKPTVVIPASPWLLPSALRAQKHMPTAYIKALKFQVKRLGGKV